MPTPPIEPDPADYKLLGPLEPERVRMRFTGRFQGRPVVWDATLATLGQVYRERLAADGLPPGTAMELRPFIHIAAAPQGDAPCPIHIGLAVERLDRPTLLKTVIMIRQYKRLAVGRHEFGEPRAFPDD
jgi:hypothetical protein